MIQRMRRAVVIAMARVWPVVTGMRAVGRACVVSGTVDRVTRVWAEMRLPAVFREWVMQTVGWP